MGNLLLKNSEEIGRDLVASGMTGALVFLPLSGRGVAWLNKRTVQTVLDRLGGYAVPWVLCREWGPETKESAVLLVGADNASLHELGVGFRRMGLSEVHPIEWMDAFRSARSWVFHWQIQSRVKGVEFDLAWSDGVKGLEGLGIQLAIVTAVSVGRMQGVGEC